LIGVISVIFKLPTLYKRDTTGKIREWTIEWQDTIPGTRTVAGIKDGKLVTSGWKETEAKNEGRANATTAKEQAQKEAEAEWKKKEEKEYFEFVNQIDSYDKFKPQLAQDYTKRPQDSGWSQPKLDGIRCIARKDGLYTRAGKAITTCDHIFLALRYFFEENPDAILDGELYNHDLREDFNKITSLVRKVKPTEEEQAECFKLVQYHVYDMAGEDLFQARINFINDQVFVDPIVCVATNFCPTQSDLDSLYSEYIGNGFEGQMVRNNTPYENKRSKNLLKRKEFITEVFDVVEVLEGSGNWAGYAKHFTLMLPNVLPSCSINVKCLAYPAQLPEPSNTSTTSNSSVINSFLLSRFLLLLFS
jgi:DNA ligase-1